MLHIADISCSFLYNQFINAIRYERYCTYERYLVYLNKSGVKYCGREENVEINTANCAYFHRM